MSSHAIGLKRARRRRWPSHHKTYALLACLVVLGFIAKDVLWWNRIGLADQIVGPLWVLNFVLYHREHKTARAAEKRDRPTQPVPLWRWGWLAFAVAVLAQDLVSLI